MKEEDKKMGKCRMQIQGAGACRDLMFFFPFSDFFFLPFFLGDSKTYGFGLGQLYIPTQFILVVVVFLGLF